MHSRLIHIATHAYRLAGVIALVALLNACGKSTVVEPLPELTLTGLDGEQTPIHAFSGKLLVLNVWATWCPPCRREMPSLERLSKKADNNHIIVAGIAADESVNAVKEFMAKYNITFRIYTDTPGNVANVLGVRVFPETLLISPDGKIIQRVSGEKEWDSPAMLKALEDAYLGKRITPNLIPPSPKQGRKQ